MAERRRDVIFRVFVSSTFRDLKEERNALQQEAFPKVREYCRQRGARFQAVDLRWGVSEEAALDQQTMPICLQELQRCQTVSPRPNFIVLLGQRYGWRPLPAYIEAEEFEALRDALTEDRQSRLNRWYKRDENALPPQYCLLPRESEFRDADVWTREETELRGLLVEAAQQVMSADDPRLAKYSDSATRQEIRHGALHPDLDAENHVFAYFRTITNAPTDGSAADFVDTGEAEDRLDTLKGEIRERLPEEHLYPYEATWRDGAPVLRPETLAALCERVQTDLEGVIDRELAAFQGRPELERECQAHREFAEDRRRHFVGRTDVLKRVSDYLASDEIKPLVLHGKSGSGKTAVMAQAAIECGTESERGAPVFRSIGATPGSSDLRSLLRGLCMQLGQESPPSDMNELVKLFRDDLLGRPYGEAEPKQQRPVVLFLDALDQLNPTDNARMIYWLPRELRPGVKLVLSVLETEQPPTQAPDRTSEAASSGHSASPPGRGRGGLRTPHSALPEDPWEIAGKKWPEGLLPLGPLDAAAGAELLEAWLADAKRTLQPHQRGDVLGKFVTSGSPLYLKLAFEEARRWKSWQALPNDGHGLAPSIEGVLAQLLDRLEDPQSHGNLLVDRSLAYLATAKNGLTEDEMMDVLSRDSAVYADFIRKAQHVPTDLCPHIVERIRAESERDGETLPSDLDDSAMAAWLARLADSSEGLLAFVKEVCRKPDGPRLPIILWSRLYADLVSYLTRRRADGTIVLDFYHRQVAEAVQRRYLPDEERKLAAHQHLANYFATLDYWAESVEAQQARARRVPPTPRPANVRKVVELPHHLLEAAKLVDPESNKPDAKEWDAVADLLTDWHFLEAKAEAHPNFDFEADRTAAQAEEEPQP